jgi:hypothetical protein
MKARDAAKHPIMNSTVPKTKNNPIQNVNDAKVQNPAINYKFK